MTIRVTTQMRERIDNLKTSINDGKKYIYESPDNGKTIYRREIQNFDDVSGVSVNSVNDKDGWNAYDEATERIEELESKINNLNTTIDKIKDLVSLV